VRRHERLAEVLADGLGDGFTRLAGVVGPAGGLLVGVVVDGADLGDHRRHTRVIQEAEVASGQQPVPVADGEAELLVQQRRDAPAKLMNSPAPGW
jgi:hypothetical protein